MSKKVRNPFNMEKDGSIINSNHYVLAVTITNQYDPTAIEQKRKYAKSAKIKAYKLMKTLYSGTTTSFESFAAYVDVVPTGKTRGRWDIFIENGEIERIKKSLSK